MNAPEPLHFNYGQHVTKDYKPRPAGRSKGSGLLMGVFIGFLLGLGVAAAIAIYFFKSPMPFSSRNAPVKPGVAGPDAKTTKSEEKPRFDFYRILPGQEEPVTEKQLKDAARQSAAKDAAEPAKDVYFIQTGSFQNPADADNLKAKLALLGLEAVVEPTNVPDKGTWYRVRLGPLTSIDEINRVRSQLAQNGIEGSLVKVKPAP